MVYIGQCKVSVSLKPEKNNYTLHKDALVAMYNVHSATDIYARLMRALQCSMNTSAGERNRRG